MPPSVAELVVDLVLPADLPSRYRARLTSVSRLEARIRFPFAPSALRSAEPTVLKARLSLTLGHQVVRIGGDLEPDRSPDRRGARIRFDEPIALPDYALLRRACGLEGEDPASQPEPAAPEPPLAAGGSGS